MEEPAKPLVSVIIVNWNSAVYLSRCLECLSVQTFRNFEVILVDNGSLNARPNRLVLRYPELELKIEQLVSNMGFAAANNIGARLARGKWLALLNTDAFPELEWLENMLQATEKHPEYSAFSSRQIQANSLDFLDGAGDMYHISGIAWRRYYNLPTEKFGHRVAEVFSPSGAAVLYSREEFLKAGGFDEDYFSYFEDVDLGFRLRLAGKKCLYVPEAVVYHVGSASTGKRSDFSVYYGYRNLIWTFVKDMPSPLIWVFLPLHIGTILFSAILFTWRGQGKVIWKAIFDALVGLPKMIEKRNVIQKNKKIKAIDLLKVMSTGLFEPLQEFRQRNKKT
ncbi:MAG TPA: glycosyltransferase family 2 protein [Anaerolineales bacterium]|nr:glycosyltransferase family 2 protein [Anaerolineales bacterium]